MYLGASACRCRDAGKNLKQRTFASAVSTDDADDLPFFHFKGNIFQRPKKTFLVGCSLLGLIRGVFTIRTSISPEERSETVRKMITQRIVVVLQTNAVLLG